MNFCNQCDNMLFVKLSLDNPNVLVNYCRNCGNEAIPSADNLCIFKNNLKKNDTKYEYTNILGFRAKQINEGCKPFVNLEKEIMDGYLIAQIELKQKMLPFIIKRPIPNGGIEYWKLSDLEILI